MNDDAGADREARLFWGISLDHAAAAFAARERERLSPLLESPKIRWQPALNWHLTLLFLGATRLSRAQAMEACLRAPLSVLPPFSVPLASAQWFPGIGHPLVVALPVPPTPALLALAGVVAEAARACGLPPPDHAFRGHVSLARVKHGLCPRDPLPPAAQGALSIDALSLFESVATGDGVRYVPRSTLALRAASR